MNTTATIVEQNDNKKSPVALDPAWRTMLAQYNHSSKWRSIWQLTNTILPFGFIVFLLYWTFGINFWLTIALSSLAAGFQVRIFIFFHDCGHGAFFKSRKLNNVVGVICGLICITPYEDWRHLHSMHHATSGNLDRRAAHQSRPVNLKTFIQEGYGLLLLTTGEYQELDRRSQFFYRVYRHPLFLLLFIPPVQFLFLQRFPAAGGGKRERRSVLFTNLFFLAETLIMSFTVGVGPFLIVTLLITSQATIVGVWLFYVQHQFEEAYWKPQAEWSYETAALAGSSFYKLPKVLQWFSGNIGFHHIHHLSPRIPNYYLARCQANYQPFQQVNAITLRSGLRSIKLNLWCEEQQKMISFKQLKEMSYK